MATGKKKAASVPDNASNPEEAVFGDSAREALPVTEVNSADEHMGLAPSPVEEVVEAPEPSIQSDAPVFGPGVREEAREVGEQTVNVPLSVLETMQRQIADLQGAQGDSVIDPLATGPRTKILNATFFSDDEGTQFLVLDMLERTFPNGTRTKVWQEGVDQDKKPIYKAILKVANVDTGEEKNIEVIYENFIKLSTPVKTEALKTNERIVDMTPQEEVVEVTSYQENKGYISRVGTGVMVRASVQGKIQTYEVEFNKRKFELSSDVVNIK